MSSRRRPGSIITALLYPASIEVLDSRLRKNDNRGSGAILMMRFQISMPSVMTKLISSKHNKKPGA